MHNPWSGCPSTITINYGVAGSTNVPFTTNSTTGAYFAQQGFAFRPVVPEHSVPPSERGKVQQARDVYFQLRDVAQTPLGRKLLRQARGRLGA